MKLFTHIHRINIQARVRRLAKEPREENTREVERLRHLLISDLDRLQSRQHVALSESLKPEEMQELQSQRPQGYWDDDVFDDYHADLFSTSVSALPRTVELSAAMAAAASNSPDPIDMTSPETRKLFLPSSWTSQNNVYRPVELTLRIAQASRTLQALRDAIADKSFQYSHIIRVAPRKGVRTRARTTITSLNHLICYHSRVYQRCRMAMVILGADHATLDQYQVLLPEHTKSSTALLDPNEPGSTRLSLSWIWLTGMADGHQPAAALNECKFHYTVFPALI